MSVPIRNDELEGMSGAILASSMPGVTFHIRQRIAAGGMSVAFFAERVTEAGACAAVVKIVRPSVVRSQGAVAILVAQKEAGALGRLNERVPPVPFVVRLFDAGSVGAKLGMLDLTLPWLAVEYVDGGVFGTTLRERVNGHITMTGYALDPARAARALECMCFGLEAVHEAGVIHRDVKPDNVLGCGPPDDELFKIADFGVARFGGAASGAAGASGPTFGGLLMGTPGYAAPELIMEQSNTVGPQADIFAIAATLFFMLTGEELFAARTAGEAILALHNPHRKRLRDAPRLSGELRSKDLACDAIDLEIARATALDPKYRPATARALYGAVAPWLRPDARRPRAGTTLTGKSTLSDHAGAGGTWVWKLRAAASGDRRLQSLAWDVDGRCLAADPSGLVFWDGTQWRPTKDWKLPADFRPRFVRRLASSRWLVGADRGRFAVVTTEGVAQLVNAGDPSITFTHFSGELDDLAVVVARKDDVPTLYAVCAKHWLKPLPVPELVSITGIVPCGDELWLMTGRGKDGRGFAGIYAPCDWELTPIETPAARAYLACAFVPGEPVALASGTNGRVLRYVSGEVRHDEVVPASDLSTVCIDETGRGWVSAAGRIWTRPAVHEPDSKEGWTEAWAEPWDVPFISMYGTAGVLWAATPSGAVLEGRRTG